MSSRALRRLQREKDTTSQLADVTGDDCHAVVEEESPASDDADCDLGAINYKSSSVLTNMFDLVITALIHYVMKNETEHTEYNGNRTTR